MNNQPQKLSDYESKILETWEEVYKKGQLTFWILLSLRAKKQHMSSMKEFIKYSTNGFLVADDKSMYRALRRLDQMELIGFTGEVGKGGAALKVYSSTKIGDNVLQEFINRNITGIFFKPEIKKLFSKGEK